MPKIASHSPSLTSIPSIQTESTPQENKKSVKDLPPEIMEMVFEKINENEKRDLGLKLIPKFLLNLDPVKQRNNAGPICNILIHILINETNLPLALFYAVLDFFVEENGLNLKAALTLPSDRSKIEEKKAQIIQRTCLMIPALKEETHFKQLQENIKAFSLENKELGEALFKSLPNMPWSFQEFFAKEGNRLIGHAKRNELLGTDTFPLLNESSSDSDYAPVIEKVIRVLHKDYLGNFIIGLLKKKPIVLSSAACFQALTSRLKDTSSKELSLILTSVHSGMYRLQIENFDRHIGLSYIFHTLAQKINDFSGDQRGLFLVELASMARHARINSVDLINFFEEKIDATPADANAMSIRVRVLAKLTSCLDISKESERDQSAFLELIEEKLLTIPKDKIEPILVKLAKRLGELTSEALQHRALSLFEKDLPAISNNDIGSLLGSLTWELLQLKSEALQLQVFDLLESKLPTIAPGQIESILAGLACNVGLKSEDLQRRALDVLEINLSAIPNDYIELSLRQLAYSLGKLASEALQQCALSMFEKNLLAISKNKIGSILESLALGLRDSASETVQEQVLSILKNNLPTLPNNKIESILEILTDGLKFARLLRERSLASEATQSQILDLLENNLPAISQNKIGSILESLAWWLRDSASETVQQRILSVLESNLPTISNNKIEPILKVLTQGLGHFASEAVHSQVLDLLENKLPTIAPSQIGKILEKVAERMYYLLSAAQLKQEELSRIFSLIEKNIDRLPASESEQILVQVTDAFKWRDKTSPEINYHFFTLIQKRLGRVSKYSSLNILLSVVAQSTKNLDNKTWPHAIELLTRYVESVKDPKILSSKAYADCKSAVNGYSSNFRKFMGFILSPFQRAWAFFISAFKAA